MQIIRQPDGIETVTAVASGDYVTLGYQGATLTIPTLPRPDNYAEVIYLNAGSLEYLPGDLPVIAAVFTSQGGDTTLTLYPLPTAIGA